MGGLVDLLEQNRHAGGPLLAILFPRPFQLPQVMRVTQGMDTTILEVGLPVVMAEDTPKIRQNTRCVRRLASPFGMGIEKCIPRVRRRVQPVPLRC